MEETKGDPGLEDSRGAERLVQATEPRFSAWMENVKMLEQISKNIVRTNGNNKKPTVINLHQVIVQVSLLKGNDHR